VYKPGEDPEVAVDLYQYYYQPKNQPAEIQFPEESNSHKNQREQEEQRNNGQIDVQRM
jgi:hypothetical protein